MMRATHKTATAGVGYRNRALRGALGDIQCDPDGNCYDSGTLISEAGNTACAAGMTADPITGICTLPPSATPGNSLDAGIYLNPGTNLSPSNTSGGPSGGFLTTLINDAAALAAPLVRSSTQKAPYYITSPTGQSVLYNPNTGTVGGSTGILGTGGTLSPTVLLVGLGLLAVFALAGKK